MIETASPALPVVPRRKSKSLAQAVMDDLTARIRAGRYKAGDRLPTEPEIMAEHGVSRTVVREAVSRLQATGLVETRHGVGTFVLAPTGEAPGLTSVLTIRDVLAMLELRISLETEAAALAALRRTDTQLAAMRQAVDTIEANIARGERSIDADFEFHLQIALATGNKYFEDFYRHLGKSTIPRARVDSSRFAGQSERDYLSRTNREHEAIYAAIERRDPEMARAAMRMHLSNSAERLRRASGEIQNT